MSPTWSSAPIERVPSIFEKDMDEGIIVDNDDDSEHQRNLTISPGPVDDPTTETTSFSGSCGDLSVFRDFFLAAFSDGYSNMACCGSEGLFPGEGYCGIPRPGRYTSARVAPIHVSDEDTGKSGRGRIDASLRPNDSTDLEVVESCGSLEGASSISSSQRQPRKRPLAVAVGYGYAEDMNGRPIVVTPNHHRRPSQGNIRASPTFFKSNTHQRDIPSPSLFFTSEHHAQPREKHVSVKPSRVNDS